MLLGFVKYIPCLQAVDFAREKPDRRFRSRIFVDFLAGFLHCGHRQGGKGFSLNKELINIKIQIELAILEKFKYSA